MGSIRVLVVDDSVVIRRLVSDVLNEDPAIEVVGTAVNGRAALHKVDLLSPDVVTMDVEMPELDGIEAVRALRRAGKKMPVIMFSTLTDRGATATLDALAAGATDYVAKPSNVGSVTRSLEQVRDALIPRIKALVPGVAGASLRVAGSPVTFGTPVLRPRRSASYAALVIGCSTGGPEALGTFLSGLPRLSVPVAVVQHMPPVFTRQFAARLDRVLPYDVVEAGHGQRMEPGTVHIAPGDHHLQVLPGVGGWQTRLDRGPAENFCRPAVDVLFRSAAEAFHGPVLGVVLTGMGQDGTRGSDAVVRRGGSVIVQDRATSVVWGMPGAVATAGLAEEVLPLRELASAVVRRLQRRAATAAATPGHGTT